jgi:signal transduction histidine kinase
MASEVFRISSGLKSIIGRDLITNDFVAIFELVKNSFDARAKTVKIVFDLEDKENAAIYIADDGKGMSEADIRNKWLFVAYSAKKSGEEDGGERKVYAGSKGVGRFSCDRLGRTLVLESKTASQGFVNRLDVDWGAFEGKPKTEFGAISISYEKTKAFTVPESLLGREATQGTVLAISNLREYESWTREKLLRLKRSLQKLLDPFGGIIEDRKIELVCAREEAADRRAKVGETRINGIVSNTVFEKFFTTSTVVQSVLKGNEIETTLTDRGVPIFRIAEDVDDTCPELHDCDVRCDIAFLNKASKASFHKTMGIEAVGYGSIFLTHNGFRVFPVGEEMDDFWGLNRRKQQGYSRYVGTREVLGCVRVKDPSNVFQEASNREGLVNSPAVEALQGFVMVAIRRLEAYLNRVTWKNPEDKESLEPENLDQDEMRSRIIRLVRDMAVSRRVRILDYNKDLIRLLNAKVGSYGDTLADLRTVAEKTNDRALLHKVDIASAKLKKLQSALQKQQQQTQGEQNARVAAETAAAAARQEARQNRAAYNEERKRNLFLLTDAPRDKAFLESFMHQILKYASQGKQKINNYIRFGQNDRAKTEKLCAELLYLFEKVYSASHFATMAEFRLNAESVTEDLPLFIAQYAEKVCMGFDGSLSIVSELPQKGFEYKFNPMEIGLIIENLASNSRKAHASKMTISMDVSQNGRMLTIVFGDNGDGLAEGVPPERIFEKGFSRTNGSGLGLYTCKWVSERLGAEFVLSNPGRSGKGAEFTMRFSK